MPEAVAQRLADTLSLEFIEGYGLSETMAPTHLNPTHRPKRQCAGIPIFDTDARVLDPVSFLGCASREVGEVVVHGPQVFKDYWNQPKATERPSSSTTGSVSSARATSATTTRRATSSSPTGSSA